MKSAKGTENSPPVGLLTQQWPRWYLLRLTVCQALFGASGSPWAVAPPKIREGTPSSPQLTGDEPAPGACAPGIPEAAEGTQPPAAAGLLGRSPGLLHVSLYRGDTWQCLETLLVSQMGSAPVTSWAESWDAA